MRRTALIFASFGLIALAAPAGAGACSCALRPLPQMLRDADAAIVGRLVKVVPRSRERRPFPIGAAIFRYRVKSVHKRAPGIRRGRMLSVRSQLSSASCGLPTQRRRNYGLFLFRAADGRWSGNLCNVTDPRRLREQTANSASLPVATRGPAGGGAGRSPRPTCSRGDPPSPRAAA